ncbi:MAG: hypothetical protein JW908_05645 [Anaerolineales bacterium]|nr:hypothetical protein [Anaerolineales bacterium]
MLQMLFGMFEHALVGTCLAALSLVLFSLAGLLRFFPRLASFLMTCLRGLLILSFRLYHLVLTFLNPISQNSMGIDVLSGYFRLIACILISLTIFTVIFLVFGAHWSGWLFLIPIVHGLAVGLAWDEIEKPGGLQLGVKI